MTLVSYLVYFVIFCLLSVFSSAVLAFFLFSNWSQSCLCYFLFRIYPYRSFSFVAYDRFQPAPLSCPSQSFGCPSTLPNHVVLIVCICSFWLVMYCVLFRLVCHSLTALSLFQHHSCMFILFQTSLSLAYFLFFFRVYSYRLFSLVDYDPASAKLPVTLPGCPATSFRLFCFCSFWLVLFCCCLLVDIDCAPTALLPSLGYHNNI